MHLLQLTESMALTETNRLGASNTEYLRTNVARGQ